MSRFSYHKYTYTSPFGTPRHVWTIVSAAGGVTFHVSEYKQDSASCGLEFHSSAPRDGQAPNHLDCEVTGGRCWHDGTSLYAEESVWPIVQPMLRRGQHEEIFRVLECEHDRYFGGRNHEMRNPE